MNDASWQAFRFNRDRSALVVIDAQNDFCSPDGLQAQQGKNVSLVQKPLARLKLLMIRAREFGVPIYLVQNEHGPNTDTLNWLSRHADQTREQSCQVGTWGAEFCGFRPEPNDIVVSKNRYSAFIYTDLAGLLHRHGRTSLLFGGFTTGTCVESSVRDAVCMDFLATVVEDCSGAYTESAHQNSITAMSKGFARIASSEEIVGVWQSDTQGSTGLQGQGAVS